MDWNLLLVIGVIGVIVLLINLVTDLSYAVLDPRVSYG